jgi:hypothetical protein
LTIIIETLDQLVFQKLLDFCPHLEALGLFNALSINENEELIKWNLKSTKIERIRMSECPKSYIGFFESLVKCAIKEVEFIFWAEIDLKALQKLLKTQEKNLKKLTINSHFDLLNDLKDMRLEHLELYSYNLVSLKFLQHQVDLKCLKLSLLSYSNETCNSIWELKNLECLEIGIRQMDDSLNANGLNNLHKLEKLKKLKVSGNVSPNILDYLKFGVFNNLEELDASFRGASLESVQEMKRITPNLKKLLINSGTSDTVSALLETLENLKSMKMDLAMLEILPKTVSPEIKHLICRNFGKLKLNVEQFTKIFPNLECLVLDHKFIDISVKKIVALLGGLKQLKRLKLGIAIESELDPESFLQCFQEYGGNLEEAHIFFHLQHSESEISDKDSVIEKTPGSTFCINKSNGFSFEYRKWMWELY